MGKKFSPPRMSLDFMPFVSGRNGRWQPLSTPRKSVSRAGPAPCRARPRAGEDVSKYVMYPAKSLNTCQVKSQRIWQVVTAPEYKVPEIMAEYIASENVRTYGRRYVKNECQNTTWRNAEILNVRLNARIHVRQNERMYMANRASFLMQHWEISHKNTSVAWPCWGGSFEKWKRLQDINGLQECLRDPETMKCWGCDVHQQMSKWLLRY